ncbi:MAG: hypothetical protein HQL66_10590 [Magnetococcales bacterium]|nr:hypothetical protein [Magnetococcales bacterium]
MVKIITLQQGTGKRHVPGLNTRLEFPKYLLPTMEKFPRHVRLAFANRLDALALALDVVEDLVEAHYT